MVMKNILLLWTLFPCLRVPMRELLLYSPGGSSIRETF